MQFIPRNSVRAALIVLLAPLMLCAPAGSEPDDRDDAGSVDMELPTTARARVSNGRTSILFQFKGQLALKKRKFPWTRARVAVYKRAAQRWLRVIRVPRGARRHHITIFVQVKPFSGGLGAASPSYKNSRRIGRNYFPREGEMVISSHTYSKAFMREHDSRRDAKAEFFANILHEMGHIFGIGSLWNLSREDGEIFGEDENPNFRHWARRSKANGGAYYRGKKGLAAFQSIFGKQWKFVPLLNGGSHLFSLEDGNKPRRTRAGQRIPELTHELMANGRRLSVITAGMLDDLGWVVNYRAVDSYR